MDEHADFVAKLQQIEEHANSLIAEVTAGLAKTRLQHIVLLVKTLRNRLDFTVAVKPVRRNEGSADDVSGQS